MIKCNKCGNEPQITDNVGWKCSSCGKEYSVKLSYLHKLLENIDGNKPNSLLKCENCGKYIDCGNEKIFWKCTCGNVQSGDMVDYSGNVVVNASPTQHEENKKKKINFKMKYVLPISLVCVLLIIAISLFVGVSVKSHPAKKAVELLEMELGDLSNELTVDKVYYNKKENACIIYYHIGYTDDVAVVKLDKKTVGLRGVYDEISSISQEIFADSTISNKEKQRTAQRALEYPYDAMMVYGFVNGSSFDEWELIIK